MMPQLQALRVHQPQAAVILPPGHCTLLYLKGYALVELHRYDEAEKRYRDALPLNAKDAIAQHELGYIAQQRAKAKPTTS